MTVLGALVHVPMWGLDLKETVQNIWAKLQLAPQKQSLQLVSLITGSYQSALLL